MTTTWWQELGRYEYEIEVGENGGQHYTGRHRCVGGQLADGRWPIFGDKSGETVYA